MGALLDLKRQGKIRAIGISNATPETLAEYLEQGPVDAIQERYSLIDRDIESTLLPPCRDHGVASLGYSSLALGLLAGPIDPDRQFTGDDQRAGNPRFSAANRQRLKAFFEALAPLQQRLDCSYAQLMIAWTTRNGGVSTALCGARTPTQAIQNAGAADLRLDTAALAAIDAAAARHLATLD
jgi:aryl-alcohol dehydrogenase-like predicted oxidoreductase